MHETKQQEVKNGFLLILPPMRRLMKPFALVRVGGSELQAAPSLSPMVEMGQKGLYMVKVAQG